MIATLILAATLAGCGGGGGGSSDADAAAHVTASSVSSVNTAVAAAPAAAPAASTAPATVAPAATAAASAASAAAAPTAPVVTAFSAPTPLNTNAPAPIVFNASRSARAGDIVSVQGENFGTAPVVWLDAVGSTQATALTVVNQVGTGWIAVQIPSSATGALALRLSNGDNTSALVRLNAATPHHLDTTQLVPGGAFRIIGRNLVLPGSTPTVTVDGMAATVNLTASDEHILTVTAPAGLGASAAAVVAVDNGNGTGAMALDRGAKVVTGASGDVFGLGVGWAAAYTPLASRIINAATDGRLATRVACNGVADDSDALQAALVYADRNGGGVVTLPVGVCMLSRSVQMFSRTVLQGAGKDATELRHSNDLPVYAYDADVVAVRNLSITNTGTSAVSSLSFRTSSRVAVQGVRLNEGVTAMAWLYSNTDIVVRDSEFLQTGSIGATGAVFMDDNSGLVFTGNRVAFRNNIGSNFDHVRNAYVQGNTWTRDASRQSDPGMVHVVTVNFARRIALVGNTFAVVNGPIDPTKNDGETILTEGGAVDARTDGLGTVMTATATSLTDSGAIIPRTAYVNGALPDNYGIAIVAGKGAGQTRRVTAFSGGTFSVDKPWNVQPDTTSRYATAVWGLEQSLIKGNALSNNPRGILLYSTAVRDVEINGNTLQENSGILVRAYQQTSVSWFSPIVNVSVVGNTISNSTRRYASYLSIHFANNDGDSFGISHIGVEVRRNNVVANSPNLDDRIHSGDAGMEGYMNQMNVETARYAVSTLPRLLGTVMQGNACTNCATAFRVGTGAVGTVITGSQLVNSGSLWSNSATSSSSDLAVSTLVQ